MKVSPWQKAVFVTTAEFKVIALTVRLTPLSEPFTAGLLPVTRILYKALVLTIAGRVQEMVPATVPVFVPMATGLTEKLPLASDNCAVKVLVVGLFEKVPEIVKVTFTVAPAHRVDVTAWEVTPMACECSFETDKIKTVNTRTMLRLRALW